MVHSKTASRRGNFKSKSYGRGESHKPVLPFAKFSSIYSPSESTLKDEAFRTSKNKRQCYTHTNLRNAKIVFVSAGNLENDLFKITPKSSDEPNYVSGTGQKEVTSQSHQKSPTNINTVSQEEQISGIECAEDVNNNHSGNHTGTRPLSTEICPNSPTPSSSSEEIIVFQGRKPPKPSLVSCLEKIEDLDDKKLEGSKAEVKKPEISAMDQQLQLFNYSKEILSPKPIKKICTKLLETLPDPSIVKLNSNDDAIADYLSNMSPHDDNALVLFSKRDLGGTLDFGYDEIESTGNILVDNNLFSDVFISRKKYNHTAAHTSDNPGTELDIQHACMRKKTTREFSLSPSSSLSSMCSTNDSVKFKLQNSEAEPLDYSILDISNSDDSDCSEKLDYIDPEIEYFIKKNKNLKRNAKIRLLSEYEKLGISSDNEISNSEIQETYLSRKKFPSSSSSKKKKDKKKSKKKGFTKPKKNKTNLESNYDELDIFDIMDFDRPSLPRRNTSIKLSDLEMEKYMKIGIRNNRMKKQEKKKEREILRNLGLLGKKSGKQDLRIKYKSGMDFNQLKREIKMFLMDGSSTLNLPPMKKADRQVVHEIANMLKLKSKSMGSGAGRFPVLYRTSRTNQFADDVFQSMELQFSHGFFPRRNKKAKNGAVSYEDGEIVGGSAPEIAADNKGRTMLEKMGWSSGTALGAINNKGILQPLPHIVKKSKKGLA